MPLSSPMSDSAGTTRLTVDLNALCANWRLMRDFSGSARCGAAVKADAYGTGAAQAAPRLAREGCSDFFVADVVEAANLRPLLPNSRIYVLNGVFASSFAQTLAHDLIPVVNSVEQAAFWRENAGTRPYALHIDTGMNRLGMTPEQAVAHAQSSAHPPCLVMSHFACADEPGHPLNARQIDIFAGLRDCFPNIEASLANSAGIHLGPEAHHQLTRPGVALYGADPVSGVPNRMHPVVSAETHVLLIRHARAGEAVSYGAAHKCSRDSRIAVCGVGYADGFHRSASGAGVPLRSAVRQGGCGAINGVRVPVIGKITMDLTMFDVTDLPEAAVNPGDWIELLGPAISLEEAATAAGTISYEMLTSLGRRYARTYSG
ncbi:alanine racemase [Hoeflea sp. YIM 152468]|uniref:alanine racemase n=1 Tax=Hoeflea sp. YIM 152468 TaxID=3031759 RepID=UPI0023DA7B89|nr:alanine racemase [Hoeflea sp. YIM 152468]MDF1607776.1 alanine racemase [Hoeflea sp. YIM 152468]